MNIHVKDRRRRLRWAINFGYQNAVEFARGGKTMNAKLLLLTAALFAGLFECQPRISGVHIPMTRIEIAGFPGLNGVGALRIFGNWTPTGMACSPARKFRRNGWTVKQHRKIVAVAVKATLKFVSSIKMPTVLLTGMNGRTTLIFFINLMPTTTAYFQKMSSGTFPPSR